MFLSEGDEPDEADLDATLENGEKHSEDAQNFEQKMREWRSTAFSRIAGRRISPTI